jgi:DNA-binding response OmpR family regulator
MTESRLLAVDDGGSMGRILVVEDEFLLALYIGGLMEDEGFEVIGPTGMLDEAVKLARDEDLDGALLDVNIVGGPIDDVAEILAGRGVPFIFVTGYSRDHLPMKYREWTMVSKPFDDKALIKEAKQFASR